jgi:hypothetical protein
MAPAPTAWPALADPVDAFCLPDENGVGAPYWRALQGLNFSPAARGLPAADRRRPVLEGLLFRARGILEDLFPRGQPGRLLASGGLTGDPLVAPGLTSLLGRHMEVLEEARPRCSAPPAWRQASPFGTRPDARRSPRSRLRGPARGYPTPWRAWIESLQIS